MDPVILRRLRILKFVLANPGTIRRAIQREFSLSEAQVRRCTNALERAGIVESRPSSEAAAAARELYSAERATRTSAEIAIAALEELDQLRSALRSLMEQTEARLSALEEQLRENLGG